MPAKATGQVLQRDWKAGRGYALRVRAHGQRHYLTLGLAADGWTARRAETELANVLADVRRGIWVPPDGNHPHPNGSFPSGENGSPREPTFHRFASDWLHARRGEVTDGTLRWYEWALTHHLLPYFALAPARHHHRGRRRLPRAQGRPGRRPPAARLPTTAPTATPPASASSRCRPRRST